MTTENARCCECVPLVSPWADYEPSSRAVAIIADHKYRTVWGYRSGCTGCDWRTQPTTAGFNDRWRVLRHAEHVSNLLAASRFRPAAPSEEGE